MILQALFSLRPDAKWRWEGDDYNDIEWLDEEQTLPTLEELQAEADRIRADRISKSYQNKRVYEYPAIEEFADAYYWAQKGNNELMDAYVAKCDAVKAKYPKP
jgi:hypothetical protein